MLVSCETSSGRDRLIAGRPTALRTRTLRLATVPASAGRLFGYVRAVGRRRAVAQLFDPLMSVPVDYSKQPLLRGLA